MVAVLLAGGGSNPSDPLYELSAGRPKAALPIAGKPLARWVAEALSSSASVDRLVVVGLDAELAAGYGLGFPAGTIFVPDAGSLLGNVKAGARAAMSDGGSRLVMIASSDIPCVAAGMVDWMAAEAAKTDDDFYYLTIDRSTMERRFPGSGRSFIPFKDRDICGGDLAIIRPEAFLGGDAVWKRLTEGRKSAFALALAIGIDVLIRFLLRRLTLAEAARIACERLGIRGRVLDCPYPEMGMDVDKPFQFVMVERNLASGNEGARG